MLKGVLELLVSVTVFGAVVVPTVTVPNPRLAVENESGASPVPPRLIICGVLLALSVMVISPGTEPTTEGSKVTDIVQAELTASAAGLTGQLSLSINSPLEAIGESNKPAVPVLVSVTFFELLVVPISCPPKLRLVAERLTTGEPATAVNVAVTAWLEVMETLHVAVPEQAPLHPAKVEPEFAAAVSVTDWPLLKLAEQTLGQFMPAGLLLTVPLPVPARLTVSGKLGPLAIATVSTPKSVQTPKQLVRLKVTEVMLEPV